MLIRAHFAGGYRDMRGPPGFYPIPGNPNPAPGSYGDGIGSEIIVSATDESVSLGDGAFDWVADFTFDTDLGALDPTGAAFTWDANSGKPFPLQSGGFSSVRVPGINQSLMAATAIIVSRTLHGPNFSFTGPGYLVSAVAPLFGPIEPVGPLSEVYSYASAIETYDPSQYRGAPYTGDESLGLSASFNPA